MTDNLRDVCARIIDEVYLPGTKQYFPEALEEMQGIADGAKVSLHDIFVLNARYDLSRIRGKNTRPFPRDDKGPTLAEQAGQSGATSELAEHWKVLETEQRSSGANGTSNGHDEGGEDLANECTLAGFLPECTANGDVILSQNWDMTANIFINDTAVYLEVHPDPSEDLPSMFLLTEAGQLGRSGVNSAGLAVCASSLMTTEDYFPLDLTPGATQRPALPMSLIRRQYLHNKNFSNALVNVVNGPRHVSNNLMVGTADGFVMVIEMTPTNAHLGYPEGNDNFVVHANHGVTLSFMTSGWGDRYPGGSSYFRAWRVARSVRRYNDGGLTESKIKAAFSDHLSAPSSVCQHMEDCTVANVPDYPYKGANATIAHIQYNLTQRSITGCKGPPCMSEFITHQIPKTSSM